MHCRDPESAPFAPRNGPAAPQRGSDAIAETDLNLRPPGPQPGAGPEHNRASSHLRAELRQDALALPLIVVDPMVGEHVRTMHG